MRKPKKFVERGFTLPIAGCDQSRDGMPFIWIDVGGTLRIDEVKRLRAWLDKAIAWMEAD